MKTIEGQTAQAVDPVTPLFGSWSDPTYPPETYEPCIIAGRLCIEDGPATHEGYWNGKKWYSVRDAGDGCRQLRIENVIGWMPLPPLPNVSSEAKKQSAVALQRTGPRHFCDSCSKNVVENCAHGLDTKFYSVCGRRGCVGGRDVRGIIVLNGDKSKLIKRIETLIEDAGNTECTNPEGCE